MQIDPFLVLGFLAGAVSLLAFLPYVVDTLTGRTRPQRASWLIWSVLGSIALGSQIAEGATHSLWFALSQVGATILIFLLGITRGVGGLMVPGNRLVLAVAAAVLVLWFLTRDPAWALCFSIGISTLGAATTLLKAFRAPETETLSTWVLSAVASACALVSVGRLDGMLMLYPAYLLILSSGVVTAVLTGRAAQRRAVWNRRLQAMVSERLPIENATWIQAVDALGDAHPAPQNPSAAPIPAQSTATGRVA